MTGVFISGTDTGVGKTLVSAALLQCLSPSVPYWKVVQTGDDDDTQTVLQLSGAEPTRVLEPAYRFKAPLSPHLAARRESAEISTPHLIQRGVEIAAQHPFVIVEGAGGLLVPLNADTLQIDLLTVWKLPVVLVVANRLGAINQTLLSLEACRSRRITVAGIVLNRGTEEVGNQESLREFAGVEIIVGNGEGLTAAEAMRNLMTKKEFSALIDLLEA